MNSQTPEIEDVQARVDTRQMAINQVGIKAIRHPVGLLMQDGSVQHTVAEFSMSVRLPHDQKGTHMSRFIELLNETDTPYSHESLITFMQSMNQRLDAVFGAVELRFPFFLQKTAPESGAKSLLEYQGAYLCSNDNGRIEIRQEVMVAATSLCPCSKKISAYGAHNQRSHITIQALGDGKFGLNDLVAIAESNASAELYSILKRPDEKFVTEQAYDNPKFVEDLVRDIATALEQQPHIDTYRVEAENFESIHNHSAYAVIEN